jgi:hypothetical protein
MSYQERTFVFKTALVAKQYAAYKTVANPTPPAALNAEINAIAGFLATDTTTHDTTIQTAPNVGLIPGRPQNTRLTNDLLAIVNRGKAGNLSNQTMVAVLDGISGALSKPGLIDIPYASSNNVPPAHPVVGTICSVTTGNWLGTPTSYTYQWTRDGTNIGAATAATYTLIAADIGGHSIRCVVTAVNAQGSTAAPPSNAILT